MIDNELKTVKAAGQAAGPRLLAEAKNLRRERDEARAENERLRAALRQCVETVENVGWGWDGDCGCVGEINRIVDDALEGESDA